VRRSGASLRLDLEGVGFVDRAGVEALRRLSREGTEICCPAGPVASVIEGEGIRVAACNGDGDAGAQRVDGSAASRDPQKTAGSS
jgi:hypothetical protein